MSGTVLKLLLYRIYQKMYPNIKNNIVVFESNLGRNYSGNPRAVYEEMVKRGWDKQFMIYWIFMEPETVQIPGNCKKLRRESLPALCKMHRAKLWITDTRQPSYLAKNPDTFYLMTWHGTPLKKLGFNQQLPTAELLTYTNQLQKDVSQWNLLLAQNKTAEELFRGCFAYKGEILTAGYPRNDCLLSITKEEVTKHKQALGLPPDKQIILYAPTWREYESSGECNSRFEPPLDFDRIYDTIKNDSILLVKYHYYVKQKPDWSRFHGVIRDTGADIAELYPLCDRMITDYSSTMFDYAILNRPMVFFAYDLEKYRNVHGFYFDYESFVPGPVVYNTEELLPYLQRDCSYGEHAKKMEAFRARFTSLEDGNSAKRVADRLETVLSNEK